MLAQHSSTIKAAQNPPTQNLSVSIETEKNISAAKIKNNETNNETNKETGAVLEKAIGAIQSTAEINNSQTNEKTGTVS
jgi:hypothetical protein